jgi:hypothetical protein
LNGVAWTGELTGKTRATVSYDVESDAEGVIRRVARADGTDVPVDGESQAFCDFLSWASHQPDRSAEWRKRLPSRAHFFCDQARYVETIKSRNLMLYVEQVPGSTPSLHEYPARSAVVRVPNDEFYYRDLSHCRAGGGPAAVEPAPSRLLVSPRLKHAFAEALTDEASPIRCLSSWPVERVFVYVDVSDFSRHPAGQQALLLNGLISIARDLRPWERSLVPPSCYRCEASLCIGDGYIFVFANALDATLFAAFLATLVENHRARRTLPVSFHFRCGVHAGPAYRFWDHGRGGSGAWNYVGDGINGGQRVISAIGKDADDVVYVSDAVRDRILAEARDASHHRRVLAHLHNRGRKADKHGNMWRIYEVNHTSLIEPMLPPELRLHPGLASPPEFDPPVP